MVGSGMPSDEATRLGAPRRLDKLVPPPEERFDRITRTAAHLFGVPGAVIGLVDRDRQWIASRHGIDAQDAPLALALCRHTVQQEDVVHAPDTAQDPRFAADPVVAASSRIRFYAGIPLRSPDGVVMGALGLLDSSARDFGNGDRMLLRDFAEWAALALREGPAAAPAERRWWLGILATALTAGVFELLSSRLIHIPNPPAFLLVAVVFAAYHGGLGAGLISSALSWLYFAHFFSLPGEPFSYSDENWTRVLVWALATPAIALMTGLLHRRSARQFARERDYAVVTAQMMERERSGAELRRAKERLESALENSEVAVWSADLRTNEIWLSEAWAACLDRPRAETRSTAAELLSITHPDDRAAIMDVALRVMKREIGAYAIEHRVRAESGEWKWIQSRGRVVEHDGAGAPLRISGTNVDVTERRRTEEASRASDARFRAVFERSNAGIAIWGTDGRFLAANKAFCDFVGYAADEIVGRMYGGDFLLPDDAQGAEISARLRRGDLAFSSRDRGYRRRDGSAVWGRTTVSAVKDRDGRLQYFVAVIIDISETRAAQAHVERINAELEEKIGERTAELRAALKELDSFAYSVSHDLRAPAGAVSGFAHILRTREAAQLSENAKHLLEMVEKNSERMISLINGLLELSQLGRGRIRRVPLSMRDLARDALRDAAAVERAVVQLGDLPDSSGDPVLLRQVWANLIGNALKYSGTRSPARVDVGWDADRRAYFVRDNGVGFDMRYADKLFGAFERLHSEAEFEGNGIGLAIVQRIVQRHGGTLGAQAEVDRGATFWFTIPAAG